MKKILNNKIKLGLKITFFVLFLLSISFFYQQEKKEISDVLADGNSDGIAVRVFSNEGHFSPSRWYEEQGFSGSPSALMVDGYEAVRDGRTVYVNAGNIDDDNDFYTNIYLISYNQGADSATTQIFNQIVSHWKFNVNLPESGDCCVDTACSVITNRCLYDSECVSGEFCNSNKAKVTRDTKRLSDLKEIQIDLEIASSTLGHYPKLLAGSYLPGNSASTWNSWQDTFKKEIGVDIPVDPINRFGSCPDYNSNTCWNEETKKFAGIISNTGVPTLPVDSYVYTYGASGDGAGYYLCAKLEYKEGLSCLNKP